MVKNQMNQQIIQPKKESLGNFMQLRSPAVKTARDRKGPWSGPVLTFQDRKTAWSGPWSPTIGPGPHHFEAYPYPAYS
ncbi:uncharacterized protein EURHEDRAFT_416436 [Aspergillus ruber CBS 135680]|uniref:Uncharacterized protein n=2 Tax=Aspergillus ruber (strain CBS 135680) TaxID=1388766 RepID=A0A017S2W0_ASPRC|nr:uncharacterized protein EURHEDRAFT_416436 [Aspergillus ruber CBS 135680]EYE91368.1 hypothetical protein EURHEDRAFT_416436 [Aspergillus ruber CBS 135680]